MSEESQAISATVLAATRPEPNSMRGLLTIQVDCPLYVWTEVLTHRRFARNASSARAMSTQRYAGMGYYEPSVFYQQGNGMTASAAPIIAQMDAIMAWRAFWLEARKVARKLELLGVAKEQRNRVIPPYKMVRGIISGTESAWQSFLKLRNASDADTAMQVLAQRIQHALFETTWNINSFHFPYYIDAEDIQAFAESNRVSTTHARIMICVARAARVSYARESGKDDYALYQSLLQSQHMSPFEHIAVWSYNPTMNCFTCTPPDVECLTPDDFPRCNYAGWWNYRAILESNTTLIDILS